MTMQHTQISLRAEQADRLRRLARETDTSMAALIRAAVDRVYPDDLDSALEARYTRAMAAAGCGRSGRGDVAERHDDHLADIISGSS